MIFTSFMIFIYTAQFSGSSAETALLKKRFDMYSLWLRKFQYFFNTRLNEFFHSMLFLCRKSTARILSNKGVKSTLDPCPTQIPKFYVFLIRLFFIISRFNPKSTLLIMHQGSRVDLTPLQTIGDHPNIPHFNTIFEKVNEGIVVPFILKY